MYLLESKKKNVKTTLDASCMDLKLSLSLIYVAIILIKSNTNMIPILKLNSTSLYQNQK